MSDDAIVVWKLNQLVHDAQNWLDDAAKRERDADERAKRIADAHARGWEQVAKAINEGFRMVADAVRDNRR
jgi:uncharacterized protein YukE